MRSLEVCRRSGLLFVVMAVAFGTGPALADAQEAADPFPRVRSSSAVVAEAIAAAAAASPTFQRLVDAVAAGGGLVFIEEGVCAWGVPACLLLWVQRNGTDRMLMIRVDARKSRGCALVASIGHELHHAVDVLNNPKVVDFPTLYSFVERTWRTSGQRFETQAAIRAGIAVHNEVKRAGRCR